MIVVTRAEHDTDRLVQSMTVNGYHLVSIVVYCLSVCLSREAGMVSVEHSYSAWRVAVRIFPGKSLVSHFL